MPNEHKNSKSKMSPAWRHSNGKTHGAEINDYQWMMHHILETLVIFDTFARRPEEVSNSLNDPLNVTQGRRR